MALSCMFKYCVPNKAVTLELTQEFHFRIQDVYYGVALERLENLCTLLLQESDTVGN